MPGRVLFRTRPEMENVSNTTASAPLVLPEEHFILNQWPLYLFGEVDI